MKMFPSSSSRSNPDSSFSEGSLVCYENNASIVLGVILSSKKDKLRVLNHRGSEVELTTDRLYPIPGTIPANLEKSGDKVAFLEQLFSSAEEKQSSIDLSTVWESFEGQEREISTKQVCELFFGNNDYVNHLVTRFALINDKVYFKRKKDTFIARPPEAVTSLLETKAAAERQERKLDVLTDELRKKLKDPSFQLSSESLSLLTPLEDLAAEAAEGAVSKEARNLLGSLSDKLAIAQSGRPEDRALNLLRAVGHISDRTNLSFFKHRPRLEFSTSVLEEARVVSHQPISVDNSRADFRNLESFTIDDVTTKDMDDALSVEKTASGYRVGIHITDVASVINPEMVLNEEARQRATTIYCPERTIHMFPEDLSQFRLSLREGVDTLSVSYQVDFDSEFTVIGFSFTPSIIRIKKRLSYDEVDAILLSTPSNSVQEALHWLNDCANKLEVDRIDRGAVRVDRKEISISVSASGEIICSEYDEGSPARNLVGEMMILANRLSAEYCHNHQIPCIYRSQPEPEVDPFSNPAGIPEGPAYDYLIRSRLKRSSISTEGQPHSSLGLALYTQVTSPIRRYLDLVIQRQMLHHSIHNQVLYDTARLEQIIHEADTPLTLARYLSQESRRFWMMHYLLEITKAEPVILGTVVRTDLRNPLITIDRLALTVMVDLGREVKPGDRLALKVITIRPQRDYIKLEEISHS